MKLSEAVTLLECDVVSGAELIDGMEIPACFAADLMSEVLAFCGAGALLLTGLTNIQSIHTADMADLRAIIFVNGKRPAPQVLQLAQERQIPVLSTRHTMFAASGILYNHGLKPSTKG